MSIHIPQPDLIMTEQEILRMFACSGEYPVKTRYSVFEMLSEIGARWRHLTPRIRNYKMVTDGYSRIKYIENLGKTYTSEEVLALIMEGEK